MQQAGIDIAARLPIRRTHYRYSAEDAAELVMAAECMTQPILLTTEKDRACMTGDLGADGACRRGAGLASRRWRWMSCDCVARAWRQVRWKR